MKRRPRFLVALVSAVATFGILFATMGKPHYGDHCRKMHQCDKTEYRSENHENDHQMKVN